MIKNVKHAKEQISDIAEDCIQGAIIALEHTFELPENYIVSPLILEKQETAKRVLEHLLYDYLKD